MGLIKGRLKYKNKNYKPIVFVNNPIKNRKDDVVGFDSQVETLEYAISKGANLIGVIADYGTGKSSLTDILSLSLHRRKKIVKPIKINLWDCLQTHKNANNTEKVSLLTRSFLYQLSNGYSQKFGSFINKILSKNYGNISFGVSSFRFWWLFVFAGLSFVIYKISSTSNTGVMQFLPESFNIFASYLKLLSPLFLFLACILLILGIKDTYIAFSHWKMEEKRDLEINDIFDTYSTVIKKIRPYIKMQKRLIIVEDLDRVNEEEIIVNFLKELYRFQDSLGKYSDRFVFIVSIKPQAMLKKSKEKEKEEEENNIYSKIFDVVITLKPIHFDDYDAVLLKLLNNNPKQKTKLEKLIKAEINDTLPQSFKWIKKGENLTLRDLKDRLNHAIAIMLSIKNKNYKISTSADFEACAAIAYFESHYPDNYYKLIRDESLFASFMRETMSIINTTSKEVTAKLVGSFNDTFNNTNHQNYCKSFVQELCGLIAEGIFNDDFRMYFYTYPKGSPIKTTDEREICNYLLFPNMYKNHENLDDVIARAFKSSTNSIIENTLKSLERFPPVILKNETLFITANRVSPDKTFQVFSEEVIESDYDDKYKSEYWVRLKALDQIDYEKFVKKSVAKILTTFKESNSLIKIRKSIILGLNKAISDFEGLYKTDGNRIPLITEDEMRLIDDIAISLKFVNSNIVTNDAFSYIAPMIIKCPIPTNTNTFKAACEVLDEFSKILSPKEIGETLLSFLKVNHFLCDYYFEIISSSELDLKSIAEYLNDFSPSELSDKYLMVIDDLGFEDYISDKIVSRVLECELYYMPLLFYSHSNNFSKLNSYINHISQMIDACKRINKTYPDVICSFREYAFVRNSILEYKILYFEPFPIITENEYTSFSLSGASELFKLIDISQINETNYKNVSSMLCKRKYTPDELLSMFDWLFNSEVNENCLSEVSLREDFLDALDFSRLDYKRVSEEKRDHLFNIVSDIFNVRTADDAIDIMQKFDCLIPSLEKIAQNDEKEYMSLIANLDEVTSQTLDWLDDNYISIALSEKICKILFEREDYCNFIIADVLRKHDMIINESIPFQYYISVYINVAEMFEIMSNHYDFLERLQIEADFGKLSDEQIIPIFKVPQHKRFFNYIFSAEQSVNIKKIYLSSFGKFSSLDDSIEFQRLMCKEENMELLGSKNIFDRIYRNLWELNRGHKGVFTRKWNERWKEQLNND